MRRLVAAVFVAVVVVAALAGSASISNEVPQGGILEALGEQYVEVLQLVRINEVEVNGEGDDDDLKTVDWVELYNVGATSIDIGGGFVEADVSASDGLGGRRWADPIPVGTILESEHHWVVERANRWMTSETTRAVRLYAMSWKTPGLAVCILIDEVVASDATPDLLTDPDDRRDLTWHRCPDGGGNWDAAPATKKRANCPE